MSDAKFDEALEAIFEERAREFSSHLRNMLEQLWLEGVKEGRARGLHESSQLELRLEELRSSAASNLHEHSRIVTKSDLEFIELDDMLEAVKELEQRHGLPPLSRDLKLAVPMPKPDFTRQKIMGHWFDEVTSWNSPTTISASSQASSIPGDSRRSVIGSTKSDGSDKS